MSGDKVYQPNAAPYRLAVVQAKEHGDFVKIIWTFEDEETFYLINRNSFQKASGEVRKALGDLIELFRRKQAPEYRSELIELVRAGKELFHMLFFAEGSTGQIKAQKIQEKILSNQRLQLCFEETAAFHIPWGLICDLSCDEELENDRLLNGFWCFRHQVWTRYRLHDELQSHPVEPLDRNRFAVFPVLDKSEYEKCLRCLEPDEREMLQKIWSSTPVHSFADFTNTWSQLAEKVSGIIYFYGHASHAELSLGSFDKLSVEKFARIIRRKIGSVADTSWIAFLNGCQTSSAGSGVYGFLQATHQTGFHGFIGTEVEVPEVFALRFGLAVLAHLLTGRQGILSILDHLRSLHAPLSLVYGLYCDPSFQVVPSPDNERILLQQLLAENFSNLRAVSEYGVS